MKSYDDLQRFKDKTRTGAIEFKDMSAQNQPLISSHWAIIQQLSGDNKDPVLAQGGSISLPVPQAVKPGEFDAGIAKREPAQTLTPVAARHSILDSLTASSSDRPDAELQLAEVRAPAASLFEQLATPDAPAAEPVPTSVRQNFASAQTEPVRFEQLFAAKGSNLASHPAKDLPLQPLLEMIASCR